LADRLSEGLVLMHPFVSGELACGNLKDRRPAPVPPVPRGPCKTYRNREVKAECDCGGVGLSTRRTGFQSLICRSIGRCVFRMHPGRTVSH
jgi:hypothetical protein